MSEQHKCCGMVGNVFARYTCGRTAQYEHLGKWYCKTHHPPTVRAKREARSVEWNKQFAARQLAIKEAQAAKDEAARRAALYQELLEALKSAAEYLHDKSGCSWLRSDFQRGCRCSEDCSSIAVWKQARAAIAKAEGEKP